MNKQQLLDCYNRFPHVPQCVRQKHSLNLLLSLSSTYLSGDNCKKNGNTTNNRIFSGLFNSVEDFRYFGTFPIIWDIFYVLGFRHFKIFRYFGILWTFLENFQWFDTIFLFLTFWDISTFYVFSIFWDTSDIFGKFPIFWDSFAIFDISTDFRHL